MTVEKSFTLKGFCPYDILGLYEEYGLHVGKHLRGDFSIKIQDGYKTIYITDFAGTQSAGVLPRNSTIVVEKGEIVYRRDNINTTDLYYKPPQGKSKKKHYEDFIKAVDNAVKFRCTAKPFNKMTTISLSSGHDSGTIVASALKQNLKFVVLSIVGQENLPCLYDRHRVIESYNLSQKIVLKKDYKRNNAHAILASECLTKILLSGLGADEFYRSGDFQLLETFLMDNYRYYEEYGIEVRYPLLDPDVYRNFYILNKDLRWPAKKPFELIMEKIQFPIYNGPKISFVA